MGVEQVCLYSSGEDPKNGQCPKLGPTGSVEVPTTWSTTIHARVEGTFLGDPEIADITIYGCIPQTNQPIVCVIEGVEKETGRLYIDFKAKAMNAFQTGEFSASFSVYVDTVTKGSKGVTSSGLVSIEVSEG